jgi:hypothetical protein
MKPTTQGSQPRESFNYELRVAGEKKRQNIFYFRSSQVGFASEFFTFSAQSNLAASTHKGAPPNLAPSALGAPPHARAPEG